MLIEELPSDDEIPEDVPASTKGTLYRYSTNRSIPFTLSFATALPPNTVGSFIFIVLGEVVLRVSQTLVDVGSWLLESPTFSNVMDRSGVLFSSAQRRLQSVVHI